MSAFIVDAKTVNRVVYYISRADDIRCLLRDLSKLGYDPVDSPGMLAQAMMRLNYEAVNQRYNESGDFHEDANIYRIEPATEVQVLKSLRCWLYQCSEGNCPEDPLYKLMDSFGGDLAYHIVCQLKAYDMAEWG